MCEGDAETEHVTVVGYVRTHRPKHSHVLSTDSSDLIETWVSPEHVTYLILINSVQTKQLYKVNGVCKPNKAYNQIVCTN